MGGSYPARLPPPPNDDAPHFWSVLASCTVYSVIHAVFRLREVGARSVHGGNNDIMKQEFSVGGKKRKLQDDQ